MPLLSYAITNILKHFTALCSAIVSTHDKNRCTRALWCVAKQNINSDIVASQVRTNVDNGFISPTRFIIYII